MCVPFDAPVHARWTGAVLFECDGKSRRADFAVRALTGGGANAPAAEGGAGRQRIESQQKTLRTAFLRPQQQTARGGEAEALPPRSDDGEDFGAGEGERLLRRPERFVAGLCLHQDQTRQVDSELAESVSAGRAQFCKSVARADPEQETIVRPGPQSGQGKTQGGIDIARPTRNCLDQRLLKRGLSSLFEPAKPVRRRVRGRLKRPGVTGVQDGEARRPGGAGNRHTGL